ncbi:MAG: hypothetical protein R2712_24445 [Vicinamibacterales bacterium]
MRRPAQIDDDADVRILQRPRQLARGGQGILSAEDDHAGQAAERQEVAFRVDGAEAVALEDELLAQQARKSRLAGSGLAPDEDRAATHGKPHRRTVRFVPQQERTAAHLRREQPRLAGHAADDGPTASGPEPSTISSAMALSAGLPHCTATPTSQASSMSWSFSASPTAMVLCSERRIARSASRSPVDLATA